jgi:hypothetical protein
MANDEFLHGRVVRVHHRDKPGRKTVARRHLNYLFGVVVCHQELASYVLGTFE